MTAAKSTPKTYDDDSVVNRMGAIMPQFDDSMTKQQLDAHKALPYGRFGPRRGKLKIFENANGDYSGVYFLFDKHGGLLYVGKAGVLRERIMAHVYGYAHTKFSSKIHTASVIFEETLSEKYGFYGIHDAESHYILSLNPVMNCIGISVELE